MIRTNRSITALLATAAAILLAGAAFAAPEVPAPPADTPAMMKGVQTAVLSLMGIHAAAPGVAWLFKASGTSSCGSSLNARSNPLKDISRPTELAKQWS